ncbi:hypothetical protein BS78_01G263300 [Paspalum vaginatum]|nr:hypothetical protein BS78_01G263300 [Paspalum vaginatum]
MEVALSALSGEILSRLISFMINKHEDRSCLEKKLERLQHLLLRVHTVVEEAERRYITNSKMLVQLRMLVDGMYQGYHVLNTFRLKPFEEAKLQKERSHAVSSVMRTTSSSCSSHELHASMENLEAVVANMREPYDTHIYIDNFMFSRLVEKQEVINALLQDNSPIGTPGLWCHTDNFLKVSCETFMPVRTLVVAESISDVEDSEWVKFYSAASHMGAGSKVIIISRFQEIARFGRFSYLFNVLAFGGTDPENHPKLASIAMELAMNINGLLLNQVIEFWFHILKRFRSSIERNFSIFGEHVKQLVERDHPTDITMQISPSYAPLCLMPSHGDGSFFKKELPKVTFGDLNTPFTKFVANCMEEKNLSTSSCNQKRKSACIQ